MSSRFLLTLSACLPRVLAIAALCLSVVQVQLATAQTKTYSPTRDVAVLGQGKRIALVIGNDAYQKVSKLEKAGNDAAAMA